MAQTRRLSLEAGMYVGSVGGGLLLWELAARGVPTIVIAPPSAVLSHMAKHSVDLQLPGLLARSLGHMIVGFLLAAAVALPLGFLIGRSKWVRKAFDPVVNALFAVPSVAFVPFLIIWFGLFFEARVALVFLMCVFDMLIAVSAGARNVEKRLVDVGRSFGAGRLDMWRLVLLPASLPFIFTATRIGLVRAVTAMITAELFFASVNLGSYLKAATNRFDSAAVLAVLLLLCLVGLLLQEAMRWLEGRVIPWHVRET
jgi:NitT/TauT family transport system permease protein